MDCKEEVSDTDSGIILQCGPDSPSSPLKDVSSRTRGAKLRQQALQDRLEECLSDLKDLCIREAELTGHLSSDYPLLPGEKLPIIRRRVGTAFRLDEESILQGDEHPELGPLEAELALQLQIYEAARGLCQEEHLSRAAKRSRLQQCRLARGRLEELQEAAFQLRLRLGRGSPRPRRGSPRPPGPDRLPDLGTSENTSLSDSALQDEEEVPSQGSDRSLGASPVPEPPQPAPESPPQALHTTPHHLLQVLQELTPNHSPSLDYDRPPIQNSPWSESSLDEPYQKPKKKSRSPCSSQTSSPLVTPTVTPMSTPSSTPVDPPFAGSTHPLPFGPIKSLEPRHAQSRSAPCTPELQLRRQQTQSFRLPNREPPREPGPPQGRRRLARRRIAEFGEAPGELQMGYPSSSEDSCSEHSAPSYTSSPCCDFRMELSDPWLAHYGYPNDGPHGGPHHYAGPQGGPHPYDGPCGVPYPYNCPRGGHPHFDDSRGGPVPYNGPHSRALPYDGSRGGPLPYDETHSRALPYDGSRGGPLPYDETHSRALPYIGPYGRPLAFDGPHSRALHYAGHHSGPMSCTGTLYMNPTQQSSPNFYGGYVEEDRGYPPEMDMGRLCLGPPPGQYEPYYEEVPQRPAHRALPPHVRLGRAPSLREPLPHGQGRGPPRDPVVEGPSSRQRRGHQGAPRRPRSLERQGAVRMRGAQEPESSLTHHPRQQQHMQQLLPHRYQEQVPQRQVLQRGPDGAPVQWFTQEDSEIASQV